MNMNMSFRRDGRPRPDRIYRDQEHAILAGVCAGFAEYLGVSRLLVRLGVIVGTIVIPGVSTMFVILAYLVLAIVLPKRPEGLYRSEEDEAFWHSVRRSPQRTFGDVRHRFRDLDRRLQSLERHVTSRRYNLEREFRDLDDR